MSYRSRGDVETFDGRRLTGVVQKRLNLAQKGLMVIVACVIALYVPAASGGQRVALVIGNSSYEEIGPLDNPRNDAADVAERLEILGFTLFGGKVHNDLGEREMLQWSERFAEAVVGAEIAFLYFAGHGMQFDGDPHLLPVDIPNASLSIVRREAIGLNGLLDKLSGGARLTIAVFDACREIPDYKRQISRATRGGNDSAWRGLSRPSVKLSSTLVVYSGGYGELVADGDGRNSPYTKLLLKNLDDEIQRPGVNDAPDFFEEVAFQFREQYRGQSPEVLNQGVGPNRFFLSEQGRQNRFEKSRLTVKVEPADARIRIMNVGERYRDGMELRRGRTYDILVTSAGYKAWRNEIKLDQSELVVPVVLEAKAVAPQPIAQEAPVSQRASSNASIVEQEWWVFAKEEGTADSHREYLRRYPAGVFSEIAKMRLRRLEKLEQTAERPGSGQLPTTRETLTGDSVEKNSQRVVQEQQELPVAEAVARLTVVSTPSNARIRIMNIGPVYRPGIKLALNQSYDIMVSAEGYRTWRKDVRLSNTEQELNVTLEKIVVKTPDKPAPKTKAVVKEKKPTTGKFRVIVKPTNARVCVYYSEKWRCDGKQALETGKEYNIHASAEGYKDYTGTRVLSRDGQAIYISMIQKPSVPSKSVIAKNTTKNTNREIEFGSDCKKVSFLTRFPHSTKVSSRSVREKDVVSPVGDMKNISKKSGTVFIQTIWHKMPLHRRVYEYVERIYDPEGKLQLVRPSSFKMDEFTDNATWRTNRSFKFSPSDPTGEWNYVFCIDGKRHVEKSFNVVD